VRYISPEIRALIRIFIQHLDNKISIIEEICLHCTHPQSNKMS